MKVLFDVLGSGFTQFHSEKKNRDYHRLRMMGFVHDCEGGKVAATADLAFDGKLDREPASGETVVLDLSSLDKRNAMLSLEFSSLVHQSKK